MRICTLVIIYYYNSFIFQAKKEEAEATELAKELGLGDEDKDLKNMILARREDRAKAADNFFANLEEKYAKKAKPKSGGKRKRK